jgi:ferritin
MVVFHFDSALELMTDGMEHELFDPNEMEQLLEGCAKQSEYATHEFMWRAFKRMLTEDTGENVVGLKGVH